MAYLNLDPDFFDHPKTRRLVGLIGEKGEIYPIKLWCYAAKYHPSNGKLTGYSALEIESILRWDGEKCLLVDSLIKVGFLQKNGEDFEINDWKEHEGHIINYKKRSKIAAKSRWDRIKNRSNATSNASNNPKHPNQNLPNHTNMTYMINKEKAFPHLLDDVFKKNFLDFIEMRKKMRKPATERAIELILKKLCGYDLLTAIAMLEQSIVNSWQDVYELKGTAKSMHLTRQQKSNLDQLNEVNKEFANDPKDIQSGDGSFNGGVSGDQFQLPALPDNAERHE